jgi:glutathione S-transferase
MSVSDRPITLYYAPATRANRVRWLLLELGVPFELVRVDRAAGQQRSAELLAVSPLGQVPALRHGDVVMIESCAIVTYLADVFLDRGLAPAVGSPESAAYLQWLFYVPGTLEPPLVELWKKPGDAAAKASLDRALDVLSAHLRGREYLVADRFSAADIAIGSCLAWARGLGLLEGRDVLLDYGRRVGSRPAAKAARAD